MITPQTTIGRWWTGDAGWEGCTGEPSPPHPQGHWGAGRSQGCTASYLLLRRHTETKVPFWRQPVVFAEAEGSMRNV